jgi:hypothetical protein
MWDRRKLLAGLGAGALATSASSRLRAATDFCVAWTALDARKAGIKRIQSGDIAVS